MSDLSVFSDPRSVAVVGASANPAKWGYWLARGALRGSSTRTVHLVNAKSAVIEGVESVPSLADLPDAPELVVLCAPAATVPGLVQQALSMGTRGFLGITTGIDQAHDEPGLERRIASQVRASGARMIGPNCLGLYDATHDLELAWGTFSPGSLGIISQSGQLGLEMAGLAAHAGLGVSRFVSVGNQVDVTAAELLSDLVHHDATKAVVLYLENFGDGRELVTTMARLRAAGKPVVVLTVGASEASRTAARSHTGSLTSSLDVVAAACRAAGAVLVNSPAEAVDLAHLLHGSPLPKGRRVAVVSDSGGQGAVGADSLARHDLSVPRLSAPTSELLSSFLPAQAAVTNPVDLAGAGERDLAAYSRVVDVLIQSGEVDAVVLSGYFGCYGADTPELLARELEVVESLAEAVTSHQRPVVVHSMSHDSEAVRSMRAQSVPTLHTIDAVARSLGLAASLAEHTGAPIVGPAGPEGVVGASASYLRGRNLLESYGVRYPAACALRSADDLLHAMSQLKAPYVLKAGWIEHKTEVGAVAVGLVEEAAVVAAYQDMSARLGEGEYVLEEMDQRRDVVELIVGARRDASFGPVVLVGLGGVQAELYQDVQIALGPVDESQALHMLHSLRAFPLLDGWRGRARVDVQAAARAVVAISRLVAENALVFEAEINPLRVGPDDAVAVDALVILSDTIAARTPTDPKLTGAIA
ncbi:acetate--CoA ligase family protein [Nocardioides sp. InS609-2]|uniref:acetate--CoA ligase family protein n=1 Tax=Nocardioides sp. InS609-2 TaxID=2760705 RepID=UPI0020C10136|nr:acetate--CoA ligase family protein [Nocardioides sp. InS609-2]